MCIIWFILIRIISVYSNYRDTSIDNNMNNNTLFLIKELYKSIDKITNNKTTKVHLHETLSRLYLLLKEEEGKEIKYVDKKRFS